MRKWGEVERENETGGKEKVGRGREKMREEGKRRERVREREEREMRERGRE